jgi:hypothetical protein
MATTKGFDPKKFKTEYLLIRDLAVVWEEAQRPFKQKWAEEIAANFDPDKFDHVKVTMPNGNGIYHICEGQHRVAAASIYLGPNQRVPCIIAPESDPARAAELFLGTNADRNPVNKVARFKVAVTAKHEIEVNVNRVVQANGYSVEATHAQDTIAAVDALKFAFGKGKKTLDQTLRTLRSTYGGDPSAVAASLIRGYALFICEFSGYIDFPHLRKAVLKTFSSPNALQVAAKSTKEGRKLTSMTVAVYTLLLETYNRGQREKLKRKGD